MGSRTFIIALVSIAFLLPAQTAEAAPLGWLGHLLRGGVTRTAATTLRSGGARAIVQNSALTAGTVLITSELIPPHQNQQTQQTHQPTYSKPLPRSTREPAQNTAPAPYLRVNTIDLNNNPYEAW